MRLSKQLLYMTITFCLVISSSAYAGTPSAQMLSNTCAGCHGPSGSSNGPATPTIAGLSTEYFMDAMKSYKDGSRPSTIMTRIAKGYTEEEFKLMADFFGKKKFVRKPQKYNKSLAQRGKRLHKSYCAKCHEDNGRSAEDDTGVLAGQWKPYLSYTMKDYLDGKRDMGKKMKSKLTKLHKKHGDKGIEQLIHFYTSQK